MTRTLSACVVVTVLALLTGPAAANWVMVSTQQDPVQDDWTLEGEVDEHGTAPNFPPLQLLSSAYICTTTYNPCPNEKAQGINVVVSITNLCAVPYEEVYYVSDPETDLTNWDEWVGNAGLADHQKAFKIDYVGANQPLISEDKAVNGVWEPGETWEFVIQDYTNTMGLAPNLFGSLGIASSSANPDQLSSGSILVPEPVSLSLLAAGGLALIRRRRR